MKRARLSTAAALLTAGLCGALVGYLPAPYGGDVVAPLPDQPVTLDPALATRQSELQVISLIYDPLFRVGRHGQPQANLVRLPYSISDDGLTWTMKLRPQLKLSNGAPLLASHVEASLKRVTRGPSAHLLAPVRSVKARGADTLVFSLRGPTRHLPMLLSAPATGIAVGQGKVLLGTGPFRLVRASGESINLSPNLKHHAGRPYLNQLTLRVFSRASDEAAAFQAGALQVSLHGASLFGGASRRVVTSAASPACATLFLGVGRKPSYLADAQVRLALLTAIDRTRLARLTGGGKQAVARGPVCPGLMGKRTSRGRPLPYSRDAAKRLLQRAAARLPELARATAAGAQPRLELLVDASRPEDRALAGQIVAALDRVGLSVHIETRMAAEYQARLQSGKYELLLGRLIPQPPLAAAILSGALVLGGDAEGARRCLDRRPCGRRAEAKFLKALPLLPLLHTATTVHHDAQLGGLRGDAMGLINYADVYWIRR